MSRHRSNLFLTESSGSTPLLLAALLGASAVACGDDQGVEGLDASVDAPPIQTPDAPPDPPEMGRCSTTILPEQGGSFVELCSPQGSVQHVRIEGVTAARTHASAQLVFGFDAPPSTPQPTLEPDQFQLLLYGGGTPAPPAFIQAAFGEIAEALDGDGSFINSVSTVCFDLHDGGADKPPYFVFWVDGHAGARCDDFDTLTIASAYGVRAVWRGAVGAIDKQAKLYYREAAGAASSPTITLFDEPVLDAATIAAASTCTTTWAANTDWQQLCAPGAGDVQHIRVEGASATANNSYFYVVVGEEPAPTGSPATAAGKLILTGGRSNSGASWTWLRFGTEGTTQFNFANADGPLYTSGPSTICFDLGTADGNARLVLWATGANGADCAELSTLTEDNALYDSTTDTATGEIWNAPWLTGKHNFVKTNNATGALGTITVSSEAAVL